MISINGSFDDIVADGGGYQQPPCAGYKMKIISAECTTSKKGAPMLVIEMDIADGPHAKNFEKYPLKYYRTFPDAAGIARLKFDVLLIASENAGLMPDNPFQGGSFNEQMLIGKHVGCTLKWDGEYLRANNIMTVAKALAAPVIPKPAGGASSGVKDAFVDKDGCPF
jgi:hypothetical protein